MLPGLVALALVVTILALPQVALGSPTVSASAPLGNDDLAPIATTLTVGASVGTHLDSPFQAVVFTTAGLGPNSAAQLGQFFNSTPFAVFRLGGGLDSYDPTTGLDYVAPPGGGQYVSVADPIVNFTWFKAWCDSRTPHCEWIGSLPAEENNTTLAVHYARWYHNVLGFSPTYWQFGNEPNAWTHYGENLTNWSTTDNSTVTGPGYATMVRNYIQAIWRLYPRDKFIGLEDDCACNPSLVTNTTAVDGRHLAAMAYHSYPWAVNSSTNLSQFFGALDSPRNITTTSAYMRTLDADGCPTCASLPVELGEYNAGPVPIHSPFSMMYPGAPFLAASFIQAIDSNISSFTIFELGWLYNSSVGSILPEGLLYQRILDNMTMGTDYEVTVHSGGLGGVEALLVQNGSREALLVVNANTTNELHLSLTTSVFPVGGTGSYWYWSPSYPVPIDSEGVALPGSYSIAAQGILLLTNY